MSKSKRSLTNAVFLNNVVSNNNTVKNDSKEKASVEYKKRTYAIRTDLLEKLEEKKWELRKDQKEIINEALEKYFISIDQEDKQ